MIATSSFFSLFSFFFSFLLLLGPSYSTKDAQNGLHEGDILLTDPQRHLIEALSNTSPNGPQQAVTKLDAQKWTDGIVPYTLDNTLTFHMTQAINEAIDDFENKTCIKFVPRSVNDTDYIRFSYGLRCSSFIGRVGGEQQIFISNGCSKKGVVIHEIFHALGRWHEQNRPDRDQYVSINFDSISKGNEVDFQRANSVFVTSQGIPYDFDSVLHYNAYAFSSNGKPTIKPKDGNIQLSRLGQKNGFSENDLLHVKSLYCPDGKGQWSSWSSWSSCSRTCNGGIQSRTRVCVGGVDCKGLNIQNKRCSLVSCPTLPVWSLWSEWSSCSSSCGSGRRSRVRWCINGTMCTGGSSHQFEDCFLKSCPEAPVWNNWSSWSTCSSTCQGGYRYRTRRCRNGSDKDCTGPSSENQLCNTNTSCNGGAVWSTCSKSCGRGVQYMKGKNGTVDSRLCNTQPCHNEYCLKGLKHEGCYKLNEDTLTNLENSHSLLMDPPETRTDPITKCAQVSYANNARHFAISLGACYSSTPNEETNTDDLYKSLGTSEHCQNGVGGNHTDNLLIDVYVIEDSTSFIESIQGITQCGREYCNQPQQRSSNDCTVPSAASHSTHYYNSIIFLMIIIVLYLIN